MNNICAVPVENEIIRCFNSRTSLLDNTVRQEEYIMINSKSELYLTLWLYRNDVLDFEAIVAALLGGVSAADR